MAHPTRRRSAAVAFALVLSAFGVAASGSPAQADPKLPINWTVKTTTTLKKLGQTVDVPAGTFNGTVDLATGELTGDLSLPPASSTMKIGSLPLATATFAMTQAEPLEGKVDLATMTVTTTAKFNIAITSLRPTLLPINLVGNRCRGVAPVEVTMSGPVNLTGESSFTAEYTIPKFRDCGLLVTPVINLVVPGPGNTFTATFGPSAP